mgnify:CR=1 FL=1
MPSTTTRRVRIGQLDVYIGRDTHLMVRQIFQDHPDTYIINGNDCAIDPMMWISQHIRAWGIKPVAWFHSGPSKDFWTGVVIEKDDMWQVQKRFKKQFNIPIQEVMDIWKRET